VIKVEYPIEKLRRILAAAVVLLAVLPALMSSTAYAYTVSYRYRLDSEGRAAVTLMVSDVEGAYVIYVKVDKGMIPESAVATNEVGNVLPVELINETTLAIYTSNTSRDVVVTYTALVATQAMGYVEVVITPAGPATVFLPSGAALLYFNGSATVSMYDETLVLKYVSGGTYLIQYLPPTITETTTASINVTEVTTPAGVTTPQSGAYPTTTAKTTTPTTPHETPMHTEAPPPSTHDLGVYVMVAAIIAIIGVLVAVLMRRRGAALVPSGGARGEGGEGFVFSGEVDERDIEILKALKNDKLTISGLARKVGLSKSVIWRRVRKLSELNLINRVDEGGRTYLFLTEKGEELLSQREG